MTRRHRPEARGATLAEALVVATLAALVLAGAAVAARRQIASETVSATGSALAGEVRALRARAIATGVAQGMVLRRSSATGWQVSLVEDGDGDGIRSEDLARGIDRVREGPADFATRYGGACPGFHPSLSELSSPPPVSQRLGLLDDPIRFGRSDTITCNSRGVLNSGTLYLTDGAVHQGAVVVYGSTARVRRWDYDFALERWRLR